MMSSSQTWQSLRQSADRARLSAAHEQAIALYTQALARRGIPWDAVAEMTLDQATCHELLGEFAPLHAELAALAKKAARRGDDATQVRALSTLSDVLRFTGEHLRARQMGEAARQAAEVAQDLEESGFALGGHYVEATAMFSDFRSFTTLAEAQSPADTIELLNTYYTLMFESISGQGGVVNQMVGDGLMAIFGAPLPVPNHAEQAVNIFSVPVGQKL